MSETARPGSSPLLILPGFLPDAVSFAFRLSLALVLAYLVSFAIQLDSASSAGVTVTIVMQASPGMAVTKAFYRLAGTVVGGVMALTVLAAFPQDPTMLLGCYALLLGACTFAASLLRDFRAYGAVLAGYTVAIIAIGQIDSPDGALLATLDRVAAIFIGVVSVALVNTVFIVDTAHAQLGRDLGRYLDDIRRAGLDALAGHAPDEKGAPQQASDILSLRTEATYAAAELADGRRRNLAAQSMIASLLGMLSSILAIGRTSALAGPDGPAPAIRAFLHAASEAMERNEPLSLPNRLPTEPLDALLVERAAVLVSQHRDARIWHHAAETGDVRGAPRPVRLRSDPDRVAAALNALRTVITVGLGSAFCLLGNNDQITLLLIQQSAITALVGMQPNPSKAAIVFLVALPVSFLAAGIVGFLLLPNAFGLLPFAIAVGGGAFVLGLASRHPKVVPLAAPLLLFYSLLLSPSETEQFNFATFLNTSLQVAVSQGFVSLGFYLILPVRPSHRLFRVAGKIVRSLEDTLRHGGPRDQRVLQLLRFDRLSQALIWIGKPNSAGQVVLKRLVGFAALDSALCRAWSGLAETEQSGAALADAARAGRAALASAQPDQLADAARALLAHPDASGAPDAVLRAASGLYEAKLLLEREARALRRYGVLKG